MQYKNVDEKTMRSMLRGKKIIDKGTVTIRNDHDQELLEKYFAALKNGNELYKPEGLVFEKNLNPQGV